MKITIPPKSGFFILRLLAALFVTGSLYGQESTSSAITIDNGLINNEVTAIHQDKYGFLWFGTRGGLNRYDGYEFKIIRSHPKSKNNLTNQAVEFIYEGKNDNLWIGTKSGGVNRYDMRHDTIYHYIPPVNAGINIQSVQTLYESRGKLYIGSLSGLYSYVIRTKKYQRIKDSIKVLALAHDGKQGMWVGTDKGLFYYNELKNKIKNVALALNHNVQVTSIAIDRGAGIVYMGTWRNGVLAYHLKTGDINQYLNQPGNENSLSHNNAYRVFLDNANNLWIGTWGGGLNKLDIARQKIYRYNLETAANYSRINDIILSIEQDRSGIIWVGTDGGGISKIDPKRKKFTNITYQPGRKNTLTNTWVLSMYEDKKGLWVGTKAGGLNFSSNRKDFQKVDLTINARSVRAFFRNKEDLWVGTDQGLVIFKNQSLNHKIIAVPNRNDPQSLSGPKINTIIRDKSGTIWVGTQESGLNRVTGFARDGRPLFRHYNAALGKKGQLQNERISCMLSDGKGRLWIGTYNGLHLYNPGQDNFRVYQQSSEQSTGLTNNTILSITEDNKGNVWIGTQHGLNKVTTDKNGRISFENFFAQNGFPNDYIHAVLTDRHANVWMSTNSGIVKYDVEKKDFKNFDSRDGLVANVFTENSSFLSDSGKMFFGSIKGFTTFFPDSIILNKNTPPVYFTSLRINNENVNVGDSIAGKLVLSEALFVTQGITLSHKQNILTLFFSALDYHASDKNQYAYRLTGFDENWVYSGRRRNATYTNLPPGNYTFEVLASNSDKVWNKAGTSVTIKILPPPWKSWWAYTIYTLVFIGFLWLSRYIGLSRIKLRNKLEIANLNYQQEHEIAQVKSKVFTNVSHEFRTPLTLMVGPLDDLSHTESLEPEVKTVIKRVQNQAKRLLNLVNQLLDFQKAEAGSLILQPATNDIIAVSRWIFDSFLDEASRRNIHYSLIKNQDEMVLSFDKDKTEIILYNLLSNAFKFTPDGGTISLFVGSSPEINGKSYCEISVKDSGEGISEEDKPKIFNRFYQSANPDTGKVTGTGIGLAFVKELVDLHGGNMELESTLGAGSTFTIYLPAESEHGMKEEVILKDDENIPLSSLTPEKIVAAEGELPVILVVEDNHEVRDYITSVIAPFSKVIAAEDGQKGLDKAFKAIPDLIISDVMMPVMDGFRMCGLLKKDERTSHIPVILLTAKSDDISHIEGIDTGADSYISKPFNPRILKSHIRNLIELRRKLREQFAQRINLEPAELEISSYEEDFIKKAIAHIEENISSPDLNTDALADTSNMSRSTFYRKLKAITGLSGSEFIKLIRLKRSAQILKSGKFSITQAAFDTGFNDVKHFRKSFQKQFGMTPTEYVKSKEVNIDI